MIGTALRVVCGGAIVAAVMACGPKAFSMGDAPGVKLADLDMTGTPPTAIVLAGPDRVIVTDGQRLAVEATGQAAPELRYRLHDGTLSIGRRRGTSSGTPATVHVTMPPPRSISLAGSGTLVAQAMAADARIDIAGSGTVQVRGLAADRLRLSIAGSGDADISGRARQLDLDIAGSGDARMASLSVDVAKVSVMGSGDTVFASDGTVTGSIMGSGDLRVTGGARCTMRKMGSGSVRCGA